MLVWYLKPVFFIKPERFLNYFLGTSFVKNKTFITYSRHFFENKQMEEINLDSNTKLNLAIIVQGPILHRGKFTYNTIKYYLKNYKYAKIYLSTWDDEQIKEFYEFRNNPNFILIQKSKPDTPGVSNVNFQIKSTKNALELVPKQEDLYVAKTRTDQAFLNPGIFINLIHILKKYENIGGSDRIIISSLNTFIFRLYGASDMFQFGKLSSILKYWEVECDGEEKNTIYTNNSTAQDYATMNLAEVYLTKNYLKKINYEIKNSLEDWISVLCSKYIIFDPSQIDQIWYKYTMDNDRWKSDEFPNNFLEFKNIDWILNQNSIDDKLTKYKMYLDSK